MPWSPMVLGATRFTHPRRRLWYRWRRAALRSGDATSTSVGPRRPHQWPYPVESTGNHTKQYCNILLGMVASSVMAVLLWLEWAGPTHVMVRNRGVR
jgi:hypothetical protein